MLTLKELRLKGIGRFVEEQTVSLEKFGNLIQVDGQNNNTGGSSGSGKSTIFNALDFLFGINSVPNSVLQSRLTDEQISVEGDFDFDGQSLTISRGKKLKIELNGEVTTGSAKLSEERLDQILSIPRQLFRPMIHKKQGEKGFFLNFTPKETNDFLTDCLGLGHFKKRLLELDAKLLDLSKKKESLTTDVESAKAALDASLIALGALGSSPVKEVDRELILQLKARSDASNEKLKTILDLHRHKEEVLEKERPHHMPVSYDTAIRIAYEKELSSLKDKATQLILKAKDKENKVLLDIQNAQSRRDTLLHKIQLGAKAKSDALRAAAEIMKLRNSQCPTCEQTWIDDGAKAKEAQLLETVQELKDVVTGGENATIQLGAVDEQIEDLKSYMSPELPDGYQELVNADKSLRELIAQESLREAAHRKIHDLEYGKKQEDFSNAQRAMKSAHTLAESSARGQADIDRRTLEGAAMKLKSYDEAKTRYETSFNILTAQVQAHTERSANISLELDRVGKSLELTEELKRAVKSFLSCSFDEALEDIGENATRLVRNIPNMANATIQLMGIRETKEGKIKEEVNALLHLDGYESVDIRSLSGGERNSIDISIDLAVVDFIETKTNKGINIYIMDEPCSSMDSINIEQVLEMIKNSKLSKTVIIVEHNPVIKEMIQDKITVVRDGEFSRIEQ